MKVTVDIEEQDNSLNTVSFIDLHRIQQKLESLGYSLVNWRVSEHPRRLVVSVERKIKREYTMREIADKLGIPVSELKIKGE